MIFPWIPTGPGRLERSLDNSERFLKEVAVPFKGIGRENWALNVILAVTFETGTTETIVKALREAWLKTRYHHPFIAAHLHLEANKYEYVAPNHEALQQWLAESFFVHENTSVDEFLLQAGWAEYSAIHFFPGSSEILMRTHHWLVDGVGGLHLANRFLELYASGGPTPQFGDEAKNLPPAFVDAAGFPVESASGTQEKALARFMDFAGNLPSLGLPIEASPIGPGGSKRKSISFPHAKLESLLHACRDKDLTIGAAVHAAVTVATQDKAYNTDIAKKFTTVAFFDYRKYLPEPYCDVQKYPMAVWMLGLPFSLPPADFATQADACAKVYKQPVAREVFPLFDAYEAFLGMMADAFGAPPPPGLPLPSQPQLSSIGLVDGKIQRSYSGENSVIVNRVEPVLDSMVTTPVLFQWSFNGTFYINACYNEKWSTDEFMESFLQHIGEILMNGMGVA